MALVAGSLLVGMPPPTSAAPEAAAPTPVVDGSLARSPELSESTRLEDRRALVTGTQAWAMGTADGRYPAAGFHTRGEMGGFWLPNLKLLDGMWFGIDDAWIGQGTTHHLRLGLRPHRPARRPTGVAASRTDVVPDGEDGALVGLSLRSDTDRTITLQADAHSELMGSYPWGETDAEPDDREPRRTRPAVASGHLVFRDRARRRTRTRRRHDWAAAFGSSLDPDRPPRPAQDFRGPQDPAVICPASGPDAPPQPRALRRHGVRQGRRRPADATRSRCGPARSARSGSASAAPAPAPRGARSALDRPARRPGRRAGRQGGHPARRSTGTRSSTCPATGCSQQSVRWSKQMLAASDQRVADPQLRVVSAGKDYPPPDGTIASMRWLGAGWPDYPWLFGTDGEYTAYAAVAAGQFAPIKAHLRALRDVSEVVNGGSGKIVHEVTPDGAVYFGANADPGNTDESSKYPSAVALVWRWTGDDAFLRDLYPASVRAMQYVASLDEDGDGWPEGLGNVEREGMGEEKLDNTVYTIRGYADLADMARARGDRETATWAAGRAAGDAQEVRGRLVVRRRTARTPTPTRSTTRATRRSSSGTGSGSPRPTPCCRACPAASPGPLASREHANTTLDQHERPCYTDELGLFHTGTGPTSAPAGNPGASCDTRGLRGAQRAQHLHAEQRDRRGQRGQLRPPRRRTSRAPTRPATPAASSTRRCGRCPARCRRSSPAATSAPTSTGSSPSGRW